MREAVSSTVLAIALLFSTPLSAAERVEFVLDGSGSMWGQVAGQTKIEVARDVLKDLVARIELPAGSEIGLTAYGHRRKGDCSDIEQLASATESERQRLYDPIDAISPKGKTPIAGSLRAVGESLRDTEGRTSIVLVSDGIESCNEDPCAVAAELRERYGVDVIIHVVGFDAPDAEEQLACIAREGGGRFISASQPEELAEAFRAVEEEIVAQTAPEPEPEAEPTNILAAANGGQVLLWASHYSSWHPDNLIDQDDTYWMSYGAFPQSIVFGFAEGRRARIADLLINPINGQETTRWARDVMVFGSEQSLWEGYELLGAMTLEAVGTEHVLTFDPPVETRYLKLYFAGNHGDDSYIAAGEVMVSGWLLDERPTEGPELVNVAAASRGATIKASSEYSSWVADKLIDETQDFWASDGGNPQDVTIRLAGETAPRIHLVVVNPYSTFFRERWAREVEVFTSADSPYKGFESHGRLELEPVGEYRVLRLPEPVTARYLRVRFWSNQGNDPSHIAAGEVLALGE